MPMPALVVFDHIVILATIVIILAFVGEYVAPTIFTSILSRKSGLMVSPYRTLFIIFNVNSPSLRAVMSFVLQSMV